MFAVMAERRRLRRRLRHADAAAERRALEALHLRMGAMVRATDVAAYRAANIAFHQALYAGARNLYLAELAADTRRRLAPFRGAQLEAPDRLLRSHEEHGAILTAILRGDRLAAAAEMRNHLALTEAALEPMLRATRGESRLAAAV